MKLLQFPNDLHIQIILKNKLSYTHLNKLYVSCKEFNILLNNIKKNWFRYLKYNKNIYYIINNCPYNTIITNYNYMFQIICNLPLNKKFIVIHYLLNRYKNKCNNIYISQLNKLLTKIIESNIKLTNYSKETINNALVNDLVIKQKQK